VTQDRSQAIEGEHLPALPPGRQRIPLKSLRDVRREMGRVYVECRQGRMDPADGSKLTFMLTAISKNISDQMALEIDERLARLEARR
jgi:hypothetical protein